MVSLWWEKYPNVYARELEAFRQNGVEFERNEALFAQGRLSLNLRYPYEGEFLKLEVNYPCSFPFFRPLVHARDISLQYHQEPTHKNLCLLEQDTGAWLPEETVFEHLLTQLPKVLSAGNALKSEALKSKEVQQAEPRSAFYHYQPSSVYFIDGSWSLDKSHDRGYAVLGLRPGMQLDKGIESGLSGAILEIQDQAGQILHEAPESIKERFSTDNSMKIRWVRLAAPPNVEDSKQLLDFIKNELPEEGKYITSKVNKSDKGVIGFVFPEESGWRSGVGDGWFFLTFYGKRKRNVPARITSYLSRAERAGQGDLRKRIPELKPLSKMKIAVIGCGCVGAPSVLEFAKAGVGEIRLWDKDIVQAGNICRWPLGLASVGQYKVVALRNFLYAHYPQTKIGELVISTIGMPGAQDNLLLERFLDGVDLLFDATAERGIQLYLSTLAAERGLPYVLAESRHGGWGGLVARITPEKGKGCYYCLLHSLDDGTLPTAPAKPEDSVQPQGCLSPTFTASSFDTTTVSLAAVRSSLSYLTANEKGGYPRIEHDLGILSLRDPETEFAIFPKWDTYPLLKHTSCHCSS